jgi:hypothetical protein
MAEGVGIGYIIFIWLRLARESVYSFLVFCMKVSNVMNLYGRSTLSICSPFVCVCVCVCVCVYAPRCLSARRVHTCMYIYKYAHACAGVRMYVCTCICVRRHA